MPRTDIDEDCCALCGLDLYTYQIDEPRETAAGMAHVACIATGATHPGQLRAPAFPAAYLFGGPEAYTDACERAYAEQFPQPLTVEAAGIAAGLWDCYASDGPEG